MSGPTRRETLAGFAAITGAPVLAGAPGDSAGALVPRDLRVDHRRAPAGPGNARPRFGWALAARDPARRDLRQTAARVMAIDPAGMTPFDSGRVAGSFPAVVPPHDLLLPAQTPLVWRAMVWDQDGHPGPWSAPASLITGVAGPWRGGWIAAEADGPITASPSEAAPPASSAYRLPLLRRAFRLDRPVRHAVASLSGLGAHALSVNGREASAALLNPGWTDYRKTVLYETIDVTSLLRPGDNMLGVRLGGGMYDVPGIPGRYTKFVGSFGAPKLILQLRIVHDDGSEGWIVSDEGWSTHPGPIAFSSIYGGEDHDARHEHVGWDTPGATGDDWKPVVATNGPGGTLRPQTVPGLTGTEILPAVAVSRPAPGIAVYDLGRNIAGRPRLTVRGKPGAAIHITPGELLDDGGRVTQTSMGAGPDDAIRFTYTPGAGGAVQVWTPRFTYTGFRYLEVEGDGVVALAGERIRADLPPSGGFSCSDPALNAIDGLIRGAVISNIATVLTDCPHREKLGWLEQSWLNAGTVFATVEALPLYAKIADDIMDAQRGDGMVPSIAPEYIRFVDPDGDDTPFRHSPEWGSAIVQSPWAAYRAGGDAAILAKAYPAMVRYLDYLETRSSDGILDVGLGDWYDIGSKPPGEAQLTGRAFTGTAIWYADVLAMAKIAGVLKRSADSTRFAGRAARLKTVINARFFDAAAGRYDRGSQSADATALVLGLVPDGHADTVLDRLIADIRARDDHVSAGDIGFHFVVRALAERAPDRLLAMLRRRDAPSYGAQLAAGATTLTEAWDANRASSQNHFMLGHALSWLVGGLAGIDLDFARGADRALRIAPRPVVGVTAAAATLATPWGPARARWRARGRRLDLHADVPAGAIACVRLPGASADGNRASADLVIGSGTHGFHAIFD